jgi:hypothetical protein
MGYLPGCGFNFHDSGTDAGIAGLRWRIFFCRRVVFSISGNKMVAAP